MLVAACLIVATVTTMLAVQALLDRVVLVRSAVLVTLAQLGVLVFGGLLVADARSQTSWQEYAPAAAVIALLLSAADVLVGRFRHQPFSLWPAVTCAAAAFCTPLFMPWVWMTPIQRSGSGDALLAGAAVLVLYCVLGGGSTLVQCGEKNPSQLLLAAKCTLCSLGATLGALGLTLGEGMGTDAGGFVIWIGLYCAFVPSALFAAATGIVGWILGASRLPPHKLDRPSV